MSAEDSTNGNKTPKKSLFSFGKSLFSPSRKKPNGSPSQSQNESKIENQSDLSPAKKPKKAILKKLRLDNKAEKTAIAAKFKEFVDQHKEAKTTPNELSFLEFLEVARYVHSEQGNLTNALSLAKKICDNGIHETDPFKALKTLSDKKYDPSPVISEELQAVFQIIVNAKSIFQDPNLKEELNQRLFTRNDKSARVQKIPGFFAAILGKPTPAAKQENSPSSSQHSGGEDANKASESNPNTPASNNKGSGEDHKHAPKKQKSELTEEDKKVFDPLKAKAKQLKALYEALDKRLSEYEGIVFDEKSTAEQYLPLLEPVQIGEAKIEDETGQEGDKLVEQAQQLRRDLVAFKQEVHQRQQESKAGTPYGEALSDLSREIDASKVYGIKVSDQKHKPADAQVEWGTLYVYPASKGGWECAIKCPPETSNRFWTGITVLRGQKLQFQVKRLPIRFAQAPAPTSKTLDAEQLKTLLGVVDTHSEQPHPQCAAIIDMVEKVTIVNLLPQQRQAQGIVQLRQKSHPNHPVAAQSQAESKRIATKLAEQDKKDQKATSEQKQLAEFVQARKVKRDALWQQQTSADSSSSDRKDAKAPTSSPLSLDAITLSLSKKAGEISQAILAKWPAKDTAVKSRMETRIARLRDLLHPLTTDTLEVFSQVKDRYFTDIIGAFKPRFTVDIEMDQAAGDLYDFFVMACEICKGHVTVGGWTLKNLLGSASDLIREGMQRAILESFVEHNATLLDHLKKLKDLKAKIKIDTPLSKEDQQELKYAAFIMDAYIERLASYLALYEETFGQDATYRKILGIFERAIINTGDLYIEYHSPDKTHSQKMRARLQEYLNFYRNVVKKRLGYQESETTPTEKTIQRAMAKYSRDVALTSLSSAEPSSSVTAYDSDTDDEFLEKRTQEQLQIEQDRIQKQIDKDHELALELQKNEDTTPGGPDEKETQSLELQKQPRSLWSEWEWWQVAALLALWVMLSAIAVAVLATVAPHLLYLPIVATVLSYGALTTAGGIAAGIVAVGVILTALSLLAWGVVSWVQASRKEDYEKFPDLEMGIRNFIESDQLAANKASPLNLNLDDQGSPALHPRANSQLEPVRT